MPSKSLLNNLKTATILLWLFSSRPIQRLLIFKVRLLIKTLLLADLREIILIKTVVFVRVGVGVIVFLAQTLDVFGPIEQIVRAYLLEDLIEEALADGGFGDEVEADV